MYYYFEMCVCMYMYMYMYMYVYVLYCTYITGERYIGEAVDNVCSGQGGLVEIHCCVANGCE